MDSSFETEFNGLTEAMHSISYKINLQAETCFFFKQNILPTLL
jgi:hypothetical protein